MLGVLISLIVQLHRKHISSLSSHEKYATLGRITKGQKLPVTLVPSMTPFAIHFYDLPLYLDHMRAINPLIARMTQRPKRLDYELIG